MKKKIVGIIILFSGFLMLVVYSSCKRYQAVTNDFVNRVVEVIHEDYPLVDEAKIIEIINSKDSSNAHVLKDYGFSEFDMTYLKSIRLEFKQSIFLSLALIIIFASIVIIVYKYDEKKKTTEINNIINYLKNINKGNYDLDIIDNSEGLISILKNEIYTTTIMLREKALKEVEDKNKLKDSLSNISHQLKTPLTSITIMVDSLLEEDIDDKTQKEFLKDIGHQVENINFLILSMLKLSRFDANVITFKKEKIVVQDLVVACLKNIDIIRDLKDINIHVKGSKNVTFNGDYNWEIEAICNILKNAIEYTPEHQNIYIIFEENGLFTKIEIIDEGPGISDNDLHHIFERFYKGKNSGNNNFGIGMSLAKEIIEHDNGSIKVSRNKDKGTKFTIKYYK